LLDTADTNSVNGSDLDVSSISPRGTPGVSDEVVLLSTLGSVSDSGNGVIELGSAGGGVEDSTGVHLEDGSVGLNGDGSWSLGNGCLKLAHGFGGNVGVGGNSDLTLGGGVLAGSISGGVWVGSLELLTVGLGIGEGVVLPSTLASVGRGVAVDELLLGKGEEGSVSDELVSLDGSGGGESPA
jgi:hypothetical protein